MSIKKREDVKKGDKGKSEKGQFIQSSVRKDFMV